MPDTTPIPTINSISIEGEDYQIEDTVARARAEEGASAKYEVGDLFFSMNPTSPAARFGGEWEQLTDVFLRAADDTETGGSDTAVLTASQLPKLSGSFNAKKGLLLGDYSVITGATGIVSKEVLSDSTISVSLSGTSLNIDKVNIEFGGNEAHSIMPAYQNVYVWERVA